MDYLTIARRYLQREKSERSEKRHAEDTLDAVLKGTALALVLDETGEKLWIVSDEQDAQRLGESRGSVFTLSEVRLIARIDDPEIVRDVHAFKRTFDCEMQDPRREQQ